MEIEKPASSKSSTGYTVIQHATDVPAPKLSTIVKKSDDQDDEWNDDDEDTADEMNDQAISKPARRSRKMRK